MTSVVTPLPVLVPADPHRPALEPATRAFGRLALGGTVTSPAPRDVWAEVVAADPGALPEQTPEWTDAVCAVEGCSDASRLYEFVDGRRIVLPLVRRSGLRGVGGQLWSFPQGWGIGGPAGAGLDAGAVEAIAADLHSLRVARVALRVDPLEASLWEGVNGPGVTVLPRLAHVLPLFDSPAEHLAAMSKTTRRKIVRAQRDDLRVEVDTTGALLGDHYSMYLKSVERWAERQHEPLWLARWRAERRDSIAKLQAMATFLGPERFRLVVAYADDRPAASTIVLLGPVTRDTRAALDRDVAAQKNASEAVQWRAIQEAYAYGSTHYNMGESGTSASLARYKEHFLAQPVPYAEYRFERVPLTRADVAARSLVKRAIGFKDA
jgi:hypothetical protein